MKRFKAHIAEEDSLADIANKRIKDKKAAASEREDDDRDLKQPTKKDKEDKRDDV